MRNEISLSDKEMYYLQDTDFLLTRRKINKKINSLLLQCEEGLKQFIHQNPIDFPEGTKSKAGKIAKGESYHQLPYYILDYPRLFSRISIFALRTMFWWGHYFMFTFHLSGQALHSLRPALLEGIDRLPASENYLYINRHDPWQHHLSDENYRRLDKFEQSELLNTLAGLDHVKLSSTLSLHDWNHLPDFTLDFFKQMLVLFSLYEEST